MQKLFQIEVAEVRLLHMCLPVLTQTLKRLSGNHQSLKLKIQIIRYGDKHISALKELPTMTKTPE